MRYCKLQIAGFIIVWYMIFIYAQDRKQYKWHVITMKNGMDLVIQHEKTVGLRTIFIQSIIGG